MERGDFFSKEFSDRLSDYVMFGIENGAAGQSRLLWTISIQTLALEE
jgi:hypothetical protein